MDNGGEREHETECVTQTTGWTFKASGSYVFNRGVLVSLSYNASD